MSTRIAPIARTSSALLLALCMACAAGAKRDPQGLRDAYAAALRSDNAEAAYALLAPELQAKTDIETFRARWEANAKQHKSALQAIQELDADRRAPVLTGTTTHPGGGVLHWAYTSQGFLVIDGLPGVPDTSTPVATARAVVAVLRGLPDAQLERVLAPDMIDRLDSDWRLRADAIEAAIEDPSAITYTSDHSRAVLRYGQGRAITFEQSPMGWRIIELR